MKPRGFAPALRADLDSCIRTAPSQRTLPHLTRHAFDRVERMADERFGHAGDAAREQMHTERRVLRRLRIGPRARGLRLARHGCERSTVVDWTPADLACSLELARRIATTVRRVPRRVERAGRLNAPVRAGRVRGKGRDASKRALQ